MGWKRRRSPFRHVPHIPLPKPLERLMERMEEKIIESTTVIQVVEISMEEIQVLRSILDRLDELGGEGPLRVVPSEPEPEPVVDEGEQKDSVLLDHDDALLPTVEVKMPEVLPQIVEAKLEKVEPTINTASEDAQVVIDVADAKHEVSDNVDLEVVKTEPGKSDVVVAVKKEDKEAAAAVGVDLMGKAKEAVEASLTFLPAPDLPAAEETTKTTTDVDGKEAKVEVPEVTTQVVEAKVEKDKENKTVVKLEDASENIPENAELIPVITAEGEHDIVVAVAPEAKAELDAAGVDVAADVGKALIDNVTVVEEAPVTEAVENVSSESTVVEQEEKVEATEDAPPGEDTSSVESLEETLPNETESTSEANEWVNPDEPFFTTDTVDLASDTEMNVTSEPIVEKPTLTEIKVTPEDGVEDKTKPE